MAIQFRCWCSKLLKAPDDAAGRSVRCPSCGKSIEVPAMPPEPVAVSSAIPPIALGVEPIVDGKSDSDSKLPPLFPIADPLSPMVGDQGTIICPGCLANFKAVQRDVSYSVICPTCDKIIAVPPASPKRAVPNLSPKGSAAGVSDDWFQSTLQLIANCLLTLGIVVVTVAVIAAVVANLQDEPVKADIAVAWWRAFTAGVGLVFCVAAWALLYLIVDVSVQLRKIAANTAP